MALGLIMAPLVLALVREAEYIHLIFAGPASAIMMFQYRKIGVSSAADEAIPPNRPANT